MTDLLLSTEWQPKPDEPMDIFAARMETQKTYWRGMVRLHGNCYMIKFGDNDIRPMWEDQVDTEELAAKIKSPTGIPLECPLCQPYDQFDYTANQYVVRRYITKVINPRYPEGFIDKEGAWQKCVCLKKGEARKYLKFKKIRTSQE